MNLHTKDLELKLNLSKIKENEKINYNVNNLLITSLKEIQTTYSTQILNYVVRCVFLPMVFPEYISAVWRSSSTFFNFSSKSFAKES